MVVPTLGLLYVPEAEVLLTVSLTTVVVGVRLTGNWAKSGLNETAPKMTTIRQRRCTIFSYQILSPQPEGKMHRPPPPIPRWAATVPVHICWVTYKSFY